MTLKILMIYNPTAGRRRQKRIGRLQGLLEKKGHQLETCRTSAPGDAREVARFATDIDVIIAAGGDGTVNEVVDGLCARDDKADWPVVGFLPMGTANVLVSELNLPSTPEGLMGLIDAGKTQNIVPGIANGRRFVLMTSAGLDARAVSLVSAKAKRLFGGGAYVIAAFEAMMKPSPDLSVVIGDHSVTAKTVIVARARCYGGPFVVAPDAGLGQPKLYSVMLRSSGFFAVLKYGAALVLGQMHSLSDVTILSGDAMTIDGPAGDPVQIDGDDMTTLPLSVCLEKRAVRFLIP